MTDVLRSVLEKEISPSSLSKKVKEHLATLPKSNRVYISKLHETLISKGDYSKFDITLLYLLCRNVCAIPPHRNKWGNLPSPEDRSLSANIERIRLIRNKIGHSSESSISDNDFNKTHQEMFNIVQELEKYLGTSTEYQDAVREIKKKSMDQEESTKYLETLLNINEQLQNILGNVPRKLSLFFCVNNKIITVYSFFFKIKNRHIEGNCACIVFLYRGNRIKRTINHSMAY